MHQASVASSVFARSQRPLLRMVAFAFIAAIGAASSGCTTAVSVGMKLVGKAVDSVDVKEHSEALLGEKAAAADERFGERIDTLREVDGDRSWQIYPAKVDPLQKDRYVVEVANDKIVAFSRVEENPDPKLDIPRALLMESKVKGKPPAECEKELELGKPLLTVRSDQTNRLRQLYDARLIKEFGSPHYCILRFDDKELCEDLEFIGIGASTKKDLTK